MTNPRTDERRAAFEKWAISEGFTVEVFDKENEKCFWPQTQLAWRAWQAALSQQGEVVKSRCPYCDDTGDVHSIDGEWRGECDCGAAEFKRLHEIAYRDEAKSITVRTDDLKAILTALISKEEKV